jgi:hypothetical protein
MKLNQLAVAAFAASMAVAYAGGDKHDKKVSASGEVAAENSAAPAGYADKAAAGTKKTKQKDTRAGQAQPDAGLGGTPTAQNSGAPAGYSDSSAAAPVVPKQKDTAGSQAQSGTGAAADTSISSSSSTTAGTSSAAPAGYADKAPARDGNAQGDTRGAQAK